MNVAALILASLAAAGFATFAANVHAAEGGKQLELKGQRIGMTRAESLAIAPAAECEVMAPGVEMCIDKQATLVDMPGHLVLKFLDGRLVSATVNRIDWTAAEKTASALTAKFGAADERAFRVEEVMDTRQNLRSEHSVWRSGSVSLSVVPFARSHKGQHFASVSLMDVAAHDANWLPRARGEHVASTTDL